MSVTTDAPCENVATLPPAIAPFDHARYLAPAPDDAAPPEPAAPPAERKSTYYQSLDLWRGAACLMLVLYHGTFYAEAGWRTLDPSTWSPASLALNLLTRLWMGVPLFFVVSGYCIAASVDSLRRKPHSLLHYFTRRFRRIYPPLWAALALAVGGCLLVGLWPEVYARCLQLPALGEFSSRAWLGNLTASESWLAPLAGARPSYLLLNTWTLCYEEQFYLVTGLLLGVAAPRFFSAAALVTLLVLVARHLLAALHIPAAGFFFDGHWLMFAMGLLVYQHLKGEEGWQPWLTWTILPAGLVYGLAQRVLCESPYDRHLGEYLAVASAFAMLLIVLKPWDRAIAEHASLQPLAAWGRISYSVYLTHFPVVVLTASLLAAAGCTSDGSVVLLVVPLSLLLSLAVGWLFYQGVERHFLNGPSGQ